VGIEFNILAGNYYATKFKGEKCLNPDPEPSLLNRGHKPLYYECLCLLNFKANRRLLFGHK
jgi:hypothetical protein